MDDLFPYQREGADWLSERHYGLLGDDPGLGKTAQAILACDQVNAQRALVVCPAVARINWLREFARWSIFGRPAVAIHSSRDKPDKAGVTSVSYDLLKVVRHAGPWDVLILDEAHYLKSRAANRTRIIYGKDGIAAQAKRVWCLSGTPAPNNVAELWPMLAAFGVYRRDYWSFVRTFCEGFDSGFGFRITGNRNVDALKKLLQPVMLRRRKEDVMTQLPPIRFSDIIVEPTPLSEYDLEMAFYNYMAHPRKWEGLAEDVAEQEKLLVNVMRSETLTGAATLDALSAIGTGMSTLRRYTGLMKVPAVVSLVTQELDNGLDKIVLFAVHRDVIERLREGLRAYKPVTIYGGTDPLKRERNIDKFQKDDKTRVFIGNIQAAGTAITLTRAANVIFVESSWVPSDNAQAAMRVHRIGQDKPVFVRFAGLAGSIDEQVQRVLRIKTKNLAELGFA